MPLLKALKKLSENHGNARDLDAPCLKLFDQAFKIAKRIEKPDEHGIISPAQIAPHFEHLLYQELQKSPFEDKKLLEAITLNIQNWYPTDNSSPKGVITNKVIKETLLAVLNHVRTNATQAKSPYFYDEKKVWRRTYLEDFELCFTDSGRTAQALNDRQAIAKHEKAYKDFNATELPSVFEAINSNNQSVYRIYDQRVTNGLIQAGFAKPEIDVLKPLDVLLYESSIASAQKLLMDEYEIFLWSADTAIEDHKLYIEILDAQESIRYIVKDAASITQEGIIQLKDIHQTLHSPITFDLLKRYSSEIFDVAIANDHTPITLNKRYRNLACDLPQGQADDVGRIMKDQREFQNQLYQLAKPYIHYHQARQALLATLAKSDTNIALKSLGRQILDETDALKHTTTSSLYELTNTLKIANKTIEKPTFENARICSEQGKKIAEHSKWRKAGSILLVIAGVATILASIGVALFSFGALSPVSALGVYLGASLIAGGVAIGAGLLGAAAIAGGAKLAKTEPAKAQLRESLTNLAHKVKEIAIETSHEPEPEESPDSSDTHRLN